MNIFDQDATNADKSNAILTLGGRPMNVFDPDATNADKANAILAAAIELTKTDTSSWSGGRRSVDQYVDDILRGIHLIAAYKARHWKDKAK